MISFFISNLLKMRWILVLPLLFSLQSFSQWKDYKLNANRDTLNRVDMQGLKQGIWVNRYESVRGEPGYEEEGLYKNNRKEEEWRLYSLMGDLVGIENYKWGNKDGISKYFTMHGDLVTEQSWRAINPDKQYDTIDVEDIDNLNSYKTVIVKNEGAGIKHGAWKYYSDGALVRTEIYTLGKLEGDRGASATKTSAEKKGVAKPKEVVEFEKKNSGKKKVKYKDGSTGGL